MARTAHSRPVTWQNEVAASTFVHAESFALAITPHAARGHALPLESQECLGVEWSGSASSVYRSYCWTVLLLLEEGGERAKHSPEPRFTTPRIVLTYVKVGSTTIYAYVPVE